MSMCGCLMNCLHIVCLKKFMFNIIKVMRYLYVWTTCWAFKMSRTSRVFFQASIQPHRIWYPVQQRSHYSLCLRLFNTFNRSPEDTSKTSTIEETWRLSKAPKLISSFNDSSTHESYQFEKFLFIILQLLILMARWYRALEIASYVFFCECIHKLSLLL